MSEGWESKGGGGGEVTAQIPASSANFTTDFNPRASNPILPWKQWPNTSSNFTLLALSLFD